ncbi:glycosyltransferase family 4 protein [Cellulomonas soli]|uniref:glycosyltransferase family 4 protein n=1 Tax=Cellulomonas soli TaxID=931535 RepID=UPI0011BED447|nr:glycosyltransferase family 4 protein [Cellulomonas soli]NYI59710.1 glycosyltransferase involved in cell wall biosynthesis [Cellulomonas soli]
MPETGGETGTPGPPTAPGVADAPLRLGFACHWTTPHEETWSGTPWRLRAELARLTPVVDLGVELPPALRTPLRLAGARRTPSGWTSTWRHGAATRAAVARTVRRAAVRERPDVVLEIQDLSAPRVPFMVLQDLSYALLLDRFGPDGVPHFRALGRRRIEQLRRAQDRVYAQAAMLLPMSRWLGDHLVAHGVPAERVRVVNPGAGAPVAVGSPVPERRTGPVRRLLLVGRDFDTKGGAQVVAAFALLRAELGPAVSLTVAGPDRWPMHGDVPDGVDFVGRVPRARVGELMDTHDLFVMPSRMEGFGMVFAEALMRGLPCVGRDACAMPEIIDPTSGGRLVGSESPDELARVVLDTLDDDALYAACAAQADARRAHYTWGRAAREVLDAAVHARATGH